MADGRIQVYLTESVSMFYLTESVCTVVLQKAIPAQIRQLILYVNNNE